MSRVARLRSCALALGLLALLLPLLGAVPAPTATAAAVWGPAQLVSIGPGGALLTGEVIAFAGAGDRYVLVNASGRVLLRDRVARTSAWLDLSPTGATPNRLAYAQSISADGRYVVFTSRASNIVAGDTNGMIDVFVRDRTVGVTTRLTTRSGAQANGDSSTPQISADGRIVAFQTGATNLYLPDRSWATDVLAVRLSDRFTTRVDETAAYVQADAWAGYPVTVNADGHYVVFESAARNLVPIALPGGTSQIFVKDRWSGAVELASVLPNGKPSATSGYHWARISADGRTVLFATPAAGGTTNVYVRDRTAKKTTWLTTANSPWSTSADARYLVYGDTFLDGPFWLVDRTTGTRIASPGYQLAPDAKAVGAMVGNRAYVWNRVG